MTILRPKHVLDIIVMMSKNKINFYIFRCHIVYYFIHKIYWQNKPSNASLLYLTTAELSKCLAPWSRSHLEMIIISQLLVTFPAINGIREYITVFTTACHWKLSKAGLTKSKFL